MFRRLRSGKFPLRAPVVSGCVSPVDIEVK